MPDRTELNSVSLIPQLLIRETSPQNEMQGWPRRVRTEQVPAVLPNKRPQDRAVTSHQLPAIQALLPTTPTLRGSNTKVLGGIQLRNQNGESLIYTTP